MSRPMPRSAGRIPAVGAALLSLMLIAPAVGHADVTIRSSGPLTEIHLSTQLNCQVRYGTETSFSFYSPSNPVGTCGTYIARGAQVFAPGSYVPVSQTGVQGSGTAEDPYKVITQVCAGTSAECVSSSTAPIVTTDVRYVVGQDYFRTEVQVTSRGSSETIGIYQYADCFLQESDSGFGFFDSATNGIYCSRQPNNSPASRIEGFVPVDGGSSYYEAGFSTVRSQITSGQGAALPNSCLCTTELDNGMAIGWTSINLPASGSVTRSLLTAFSPTGVPFAPPQIAPPPVETPPATGPPPGDRDADSIPDVVDNCPDAANLNQSDVDRDRIGDVCDTSDASVPPEVGETVIARVVSGEVFFKPPGASSRSTAGASQATPAGYTPVKGAAVIPVGSVVHTTRGRLAVTSVNSATRGGTTVRTQTAQFYSGIFQIRQARSRRPVTELRLRSTNFSSVCGSTSRTASGPRAIAAQRRSRVVSRLWGNGRGRFRTRGRHSAATVRGTIWLTQERCDGTLTRVTRGSVSVRDQTARRTVVVRAGRSYLARARRATVRRR